MIKEYNFTEFSPRVRKLHMDDEQRHTAMTFGSGSYMVNGRFECGVWEGHVLVGRYSALGHRLTFELGLNHDYRQVTT